MRPMWKKTNTENNGQQINGENKKHNSTYLNKIKGHI